MKPMKDLPPRDICYHIKDNVSKEGWERFCMRAWGIWKDRCNIIHNQSKPERGSCPQDHWADNIYKAFKMISEADKIKHKDLVYRYGLKNEGPMEKCYSIHADAAYNKHSNKYAYGFILKDSDNIKKAEVGIPLKPPGTIMNAEILAIIKCLEHWMTIKTGRVRIFSDSVEAIHAINTDSDYKGIEEENILRARSLSRDSSVEGVYYCPRETNREAHNIARAACRISPSSRLDG